MHLRLQLLIIFASLLIFIVVFELLRRGRLREQYSLLWLVGSFFVFLMALLPGSVRLLADIFKVDYAPSLLFLITIIFILVIQLAQTVTISNLTTQNRTLNQKIASLDLRLQQTSLQIVPRIITTMSRLAPTSAQTTVDENDSNSGRTQSLLYILKLSMESLGASSGSITLLDAQRRPVETVTSYEGKERSSTEKELDYTTQKGLAGWVIENRQPALVIDTSEDNRWLKRSWDVSNGKTRSAISVPLKSGGWIIGVITLVQNEARSFSENDLAILMAIAEHLALSGTIPLDTYVQ